MYCYHTYITHKKSSLALALAVAFSFGGPSGYTSVNPLAPLCPCLFLPPVSVIGIIKYQ